MRASNNTILRNIYYKLNAPRFEFVNFQIVEYANELICIIAIKGICRLALNVELVSISYQKYNKL